MGKEIPVITKGVACEPPKNEGVQRRTAAGGALNVPDFKSGLVSLTTVFNSLYRVGDEVAELWAGDSIYVPTEAVSAGRWSKEILDIDGQKFVLVPPEFIVGYRRLEDRRLQSLAGSFADEDSEE